MLHEAKIAYYAFDVINCLYEADTPPYFYRSRSCADVLRGERADVTDFFSRDLGGWVRGQA